MCSGCHILQLHFIYSGVSLPCSPDPSRQWCFIFFFKWQLQSVTLIIRSNFYSSSISIHTNIKGNLTSYHKSSKCLDYFFRLKLHNMIQAICTLNINAWVKKLSFHIKNLKVWGFRFYIVLDMINRWDY